MGCYLVYSVSLRGTIGLSNALHGVRSGTKTNTSLMM